MQREYRVMVERRNALGRKVIINRPENPFDDREQARLFAARFTPPKFERAWVETRTPGAWRRMP